MRHVYRFTPRRLESRTGYPVRREAPPLRVSTVLCLLLGGMTLVVLLGKGVDSLVRNDLDDRGAHTTSSWSPQ